MRTSQPLHILCYHRVLDDENLSENHPYFQRGTAVSTSVFKKQIIDLSGGFDCIDEHHAIEFLEGKITLNRPSCWITFDDAYTEVFDVVDPILKNAKLPASLFVSTQVLKGEGLPADRWFAVLNSARLRRGLLKGLGGRAFNLDNANSLNSLIHGQERKAYLRSPKREQHEMLNLFQIALDSTNANTPDLYLTASKVKKLSKENTWTIGSHSVSHPILTNLSENQQYSEMDDSRKGLNALGIEPSVFAYPDGAYDTTSLKCVENSGYKAALTLNFSPQRLHAEFGDNIFSVPRVLVKNTTNFVHQLKGYNIEPNL